MKASAKSLFETTQRAITVLYKELGIVETLRFFNQFSAGYGDYTRERSSIFRGLTIDKILSEIRHIGPRRSNEVFQTTGRSGRAGSKSKRVSHTARD